MVSSLRVPTIAFITGASRGIGRAIAIQLAQRIDPASSSLHLTARTPAGLEETADMIWEHVDRRLDVKCIESDLTDENGVKQLALQLFRDVGPVPGRYSHAFIAHSAAALGPLEKYSRDVNDINDIQKYCMSNISSAIVLTSSFLKCFEGDSNIRKTIVQLTSRSGVLPQKTMHLYGMGKAARDMYFKVVALEEPGVKVLNFNPGFVNTDTYSNLQESADKEFREARTYFSNQSYFLSPEQAADAMLKAIEDDQYESGSTLSSYDVLDIDINK